MRARVIRSFINKEPRFWTFQIMGWLFFSMLDYRMNSVAINDLADHFMWLSSIIIPFTISLGLRYLYRSLYITNLNFLTISFAAILASCFGGILIHYSRAIIFTLDFLHKYENIDSYLEVYTRGGFIVTIINFSTPLFGWSVIYFGMKSWIDLVDEKKRSQETRLQAQESKLQMLRYQINPHFLFNSLNSIQALMNHNTKVADKMLTQLSDFLRYSLIADDRIYVPLKREIEIIEKYISIEKIRFNSKLDYQIEFTPDVLDQEILCFILQPLVENAIKHGFKSSPKKLLIVVSAFQEDSWLNIIIKNTGKWIIDESKSGKGIKNVRERLDNAYPGNHDFDISEKEGYVIITLKIKLVNEEV